jgi:hypothetical protein
MVPIVSTVSRAADLLRLDQAQLAQAVQDAELEPWPWLHADGSRVYPWAGLCEVAAQLRVTVAPPQRGGTQAQRRQRHREQQQGNQT